MLCFILTLVYSVEKISSKTRESVHIARREEDHISERQHFTLLMSSGSESRMMYLMPIEQSEDVLTEVLLHIEISIRRYYSDLYLDSSSDYNMTLAFASLL
jgi:hypothetical protein